MAVLDKDAFFEQIGYKPHPLQIAFHESPARFKIPSCGRRFGKTTMGARDLEPQLFADRQRFWIVGPTYDLGEKEFRVIWDDLIVRAGLGRDKRVRKAYNLKQGDMFIELPWQTRVQVRSADHASTLVGERLNGVIMAEAAKHSREAWERYIRPGLADVRGWAVFPSTPEGHNWYYDLWRLGQNPDYPEYESWRFPSWANPVVYPGGRDDPEIKLLEMSSSPEWFMQEIGADFASFTGKIYGEFDEAKHVKKLEYNPNWENFIFFDWGFVNPLAALDVQVGKVNGREVIHVWREHYKSYMRLEEHIAYLKSRANPNGYRINCTFGDAEDPEAVATINHSFAACVAMPEAKTNWRQGIEVVKRFLKMRQVGEVDEYGTPKMEPALFIDHSCKETIREFQTYRAAPPSKGVTGQAEKAIKKDDHALDALRYGIMHLFELGATRHLSELYRVGDLMLANEGISAPIGGYFTQNLSF